MVPDAANCDICSLRCSEAVIDVDHNLAGGTIPLCSISLANAAQRESPRVKTWNELAGFNQPRCLAQDFAVMRAAFP
jgi:hypothetical protein